MVARNKETQAKQSEQPNEVKRPRAVLFMPYSSPTPSPPAIPKALLPLFDDTEDPIPPLNLPPFDSSLLVLGSQRGSHSWCTWAITFFLSPEEYTLISRWNKKFFGKEDMTRTMCVSFACYSYQDVIYAPHRDIDCYMSLDRIVSTLRPVCWPSPNTPRITVNEGQSWAIPSHSESTAYMFDECVDLSRLVRPGDNHLTFSQTTDMSESFFVVQMHPPTRGQLAEVEDEREKDAAWMRDALAVFDEIRT